ncbi:MAG: 30S ribosomal protein S17 [Candidatus Aenigmatarchaeota archaeon]
MKIKNIGIEGIKPPEKTCSDPKCCWHGKIRIRGNIIRGKVVSTKPSKTAIIIKDYYHYIPKYERYERRHSRIAAYKPDCIDVKEGDEVIIGETRPLSKTKAFVVLQVVK